MSHRLSHNARHTNDLLQELERDKELEVLREYLTRFNLFPPKRDPASAAIRFEELKELVKHWKLHRQRNFWKNHATKEDLVRTLYRHINTKIKPQEAREEANTSLATGGHAAAMTSMISPTAPSRQQSVSRSYQDSPRSKSVLLTTPDSSSGPNTTKVFNTYKGDLFSQRGDYEDAIIYLSRFKNPGITEIPAHTEVQESNQNISVDEEEEDVNEELTEPLKGNDGQLREIRLKQECAFSIYHFSTEIGSEPQMVAEGVMAALNRLSSFEDTQIKRFCAATILNLSWNDSISPRMIDEGVLLALLELAKVQHDEVRRNTAMALCRLSYDRIGQFRLVQEGCVSAIISMLNSPEDLTKDACLKALINIASYSGSMVSESVIQIILKLSTRDDATLLLVITECIYNLSLLTQPRAKAIQDGLLETLQDIVQSCEDIAGKRNIATALCNFSGLSTNHDALGQVSILETILSLLECDDSETHDRCAIFVSNLASNHSSLIAILHANIVPKLVHLCAKGSSIVRENTALTLSYIAVVEEGLAVLNNPEIISLLVLFLGSESVLTRQYAITTLCSIMAGSAASMLLSEKNIPAVLASMTQNAQEKTKELAANALYNLSCDGSVSHYLLTEEVVSILVHLCKKFVVNSQGVLEEERPLTGKNRPPVTLNYTQRCALGCLYNLSFDPNSRTLLVKAGVLPTLFNIFKRPVKNEDLIKQCATVVANLTFEPEVHASMISDNAVPLVRKLMHSTNRDILQCCAISCCNLALEALESTAVLTMLVDLSAATDPKVSLTCALAFARLTSHSDYRPVLTKCLELYPALIIMMRCGVEEIQIYSAITICNLAVEPNPRSRHIWKEGTVPDFIVNSLLRINSDSTKEICARALFNLLTHHEYRMAHIREGVLYALVKLARLESYEIRSLCILVLYNLSCDPNMVNVLMDIHTSQVVAKMCEMEFPDEKPYQQLAACLMNMAVKSDIAVSLVGDGALTAVQVLSASKDRNTRRYCASVLCNLSADESNCEAMASSQLLEVLVECLSSEENDHRMYALNALCNISCSQMLHYRLEETGAISRVLALLPLAEKHKIFFSCIRMLHNLTYHTKYSNLMVEQDVIASLIEVFSKADISVEEVDLVVSMLSVLCGEVDVWDALIKKGAVRLLCLMSKKCSAASKETCIYSLSQLARHEAGRKTVLDDGALNILASIFIDEYEQPMEVKTVTTEEGAFILRALATSSSCTESLLADTRLVPLLQSVTSAERRDACKHAVIAIYGLSASKSPALAALVDVGIEPIIVHLASVCGSDMAPICATSLSRIKASETTEEGEAEATVPVSPPSSPSRKMKSGIIATLLTMVDLDPNSIQKMDKTTTIVPPAPEASTRPRDDTWKFYEGVTFHDLQPPLDVCWEVQNSPVNDEQFVPSAPDTFLHYLSPVVPTSTATLQEKLCGEFRIMRVSHDKVYVKGNDIDLETGEEPGENADDTLANAISNALVDVPMPMNPNLASNSMSNDENEADELRKASPMVKTKSFRAVASLVRVASRSSISKQNPTKNFAKRGSSSALTGGKPTKDTPRKQNGQNGTTLPKL